MLRIDVSTLLRKHRVQHHDTTAPFRRGVYLCSFLQQQLHTIGVSHHAGAVQRLQSAMHAVHIRALQKHGGVKRVRPPVSRIESYRQAAKEKLVLLASRARFWLAVTLFRAHPLLVGKLSLIPPSPTLPDAAPRHSLGPCRRHGEQSSAPPREELQADTRPPRSLPFINGNGSGRPHRSPVRSDPPRCPSERSGWRRWCG